MYLRIPQYISTTYVKLSTRYTTWSTICVHILSCVLHNMFSTTYTVYSTGYRYTLWVTCCGDVYIYCGEQRAYVVGDTRVPHNICFWCCPQHVTHKLCQGCSPQHMSLFPTIYHMRSTTYPTRAKMSSPRYEKPLKICCTGIHSGYVVDNVPYSLWVTNYMLWSA